MKRCLKMLAIIMTVLIAILSGCSNKPKHDQKKTEAVRNYSATIGDDAKEYFAELSKSTCGVNPERVYCSIPEYTPDEILEADPVPWQEMMMGTPPCLIVELHKKPEVYHVEEDCYTEDEIHAVLSEAVARGLVMDFCFDSDRETYSIDKDGKITVETILGADGGAYRERRDYEL